MKKLAVGIMSGTSLDGIDVALANISGTDENTKIEFLDGITVDWPQSTKANIEKAVDIEKSTVQLISTLNFEISHCYYDAIKEICKKNKINMKNIDFIAIHGQTIWHDPYGVIPSTLQIGDGSVLAELTNVTVVSNFRPADIAAGGQGAPLVPFFDKIIFGKKEGVNSIHNLGGISNLSLFKDGELAVAFDTGPANMMIDYVTNKFFNRGYDEDGNLARKGDIIKPLYDEVMSLDYFSIKPPKSTGREVFGNDYVERLIKKHPNYKEEDYVTTFSKVTADSIVDSYLELIKENDKVDEIIFSGGGAHNKFVINEIKKGLPNVKISLSSDYGISFDFKEAIAFIVLGNQTLNNKISNLKAATGAAKEVVLGQISFR